MSAAIRRPGRAARLLCAVVVLAVPAATAAGQEDGAAVLRGLQLWLDDTRDLEGAFSQQLLSGALGADLQESGRLFVLRPGRMRWDYHDPERKVALVNGLRTSLYLEEDGQLILGELEQDGGLLPTLLTSELRLDALFEAELVDLPGYERDEICAVRLLPRTGRELLEEVTLLLRRPHYAIQAAEVVDSAGNRIIYRFSQLQRNRGLDATLFEFEPPPGTEILGDPGG